MFVAVAGLLALSGALFVVSMFAPVTRTDSVNAQDLAPNSRLASGTPGTSPAGAAPAASATAPGAASRSPAAPRTSRPGTAPKASPSPPGTGVTADEAAVLTLVNQQRAKAGCAALTRDSRLASAARAHSADMAARGYFDHTTPSGVTAAQRVSNAGYRWSSMGENIAAGQRTPADVMQAWMNSSGHRANILNCGFRNIGVGLAYDSRHTPYWTQDFASPR
ncbi:MAG: hypothetical protein V7603_4722 [Micromonosporaceae bacterium]